METDRASMVKPQSMSEVSGMVTPPFPPPSTDLPNFSDTRYLGRSHGPGPPGVWAGSSMPSLIHDVMPQDFYTSQGTYPSLPHHSDISTHTVSSTDQKAAHINSNITNIMPCLPGPDQAIEYGYPHFVKETQNIHQSIFAKGQHSPFSSDSVTKPVKKIKKKSKKNQDSNFPKVSKESELSAYNVSMQGSLSDGYKKHLLKLPTDDLEREVPGSDPYTFPGMEAPPNCNRPPIEMPPQFWNTYGIMPTSVMQYGVNTQPEAKSATKKTKKTNSKPKQQSGGKPETTKKEKTKRTKKKSALPVNEAGTLLDSRMMMEWETLMGGGTSTDGGTLMDSQQKLCKSTFNKPSLYQASSIMDLIGSTVEQVMQKSKMESEQHSYKGNQDSVPLTSKLPLTSSLPSGNQSAAIVMSTSVLTNAKLPDAITSQSNVCTDWSKPCCSDCERLGISYSPMCKNRPRIGIPADLLTSSLVESIYQDQLRSQTDQYGETNKGELQQKISTTVQSSSIKNSTELNIMVTSTSAKQSYSACVLPSQRVSDSYFPQDAHMYPHTSSFSVPAETTVTPSVQQVLSHSVIDSQPVVPSTADHPASKDSVYAPSDSNISKPTIIEPVIQVNAESVPVSLGSGDVSALLPSEQSTEHSKSVPWPDWPNMPDAYEIAKKLNVSSSLPVSLAQYQGWQQEYAALTQFMQYSQLGPQSGNISHEQSMNLQSPAILQTSIPSTLPGVMNMPKGKTVSTRNESAKPNSVLSSLPVAANMSHGLQVSAPSSFSVNDYNGQCYIQNSFSSVTSSQNPSLVASSQSPMFVTPSQNTSPVSSSSPLGHSSSPTYVTNPPSQSVPYTPLPLSTSPLQEQVASSSALLPTVTSMPISSNEQFSGVSCMPLLDQSQLIISEGSQPGAPSSSVLFRSDMAANCQRSQHQTLSHTSSTAVTSVTQVQVTPISSVLASDVQGLSSGGHHICSSHTSGSLSQSLQGESSCKVSTVAAKSDSIISSTSISGLQEMFLPYTQGRHSILPTSEASLNSSHVSLTNSAQSANSANGNALSLNTNNLLPSDSALTLPAGETSTQGEIRPNIPVIPLTASNSFTNPVFSNPGFQLAAVNSMEVVSSANTSIPELDWVTQHVNNLKTVLTEEEQLIERLKTNAKLEMPRCTCRGPDCKFNIPNEETEGPYYTHLGAAKDMCSVRALLERRTGATGKALRIEKIVYTGKEGKSSQGCPIAKWIIRRSGPEEKYLTIVKQRPGHYCDTAFLVVVIVVWEGVPQPAANDLYSFLVPTLTKYGFETERRCGTNERKTCACQGIDLTKRGASFSFGCSWSMYFNGCKFARSREPKKFKLNTKDHELEQQIEHKLQNLATSVGPLYHEIAPDAYRNQTEFEAQGEGCRLGYKPGRPFSGVTACVDFCAHSHKDFHNINNGSTVVVTLTKHRGFSKADDEQLHVLPCYVLDMTDENGDPEMQLAKIRAGSLQVLNNYPLEVRTRACPLTPKRKKCSRKNSPASKKGSVSPVRGRPRLNANFSPVGCKKKGGTLKRNQSLPDLSNQELFQQTSPLAAHNHPPVQQEKGVSNMYLTYEEMMTFSSQPGFNVVYESFWNYFYAHGTFPPSSFLSPLSKQKSPKIKKSPSRAKSVKQLCKTESKPLEKMDVCLNEKSNSAPHSTIVSQIKREPIPMLDDPVSYVSKKLKFSQLEEETIPLDLSVVRPQSASAGFITPKSIPNRFNTKSENGVLSSDVTTGAVYGRGEINHIGLVNETSASVLVSDREIKPSSILHYMGDGTQAEFGISKQRLLTDYTEHRKDLYSYKSTLCHEAKMESDFQNDQQNTCESKDGKIIQMRPDLATAMKLLPGNIITDPKNGSDIKKEVLLSVEAKNIGSKEISKTPFDIGNLISNDKSFSRIGELHSGSLCDKIGTQNTVQNPFFINSLVKSEPGIEIDAKKNKQNVNHSASYPELDRNSKSRATVHAKNPFDVDSLISSNSKSKEASAGVNFDPWIYPRAASVDATRLIQRSESRTSSEYGYVTSSENKVEFEGVMESSSYVKNPMSRDLGSVSKSGASGMKSASSRSADMLSLSSRSHCMEKPPTVSSLDIFKQTYVDTTKSMSRPGSVDTDKISSIYMNSSCSRPESVGNVNRHASVIDQFLNQKPREITNPLSRPQSVGIIDPLSRFHSVGIMDPLSRPQSVGIMDPLSRPQSVGIIDPLSRPQSVGIMDPLSRPLSVGIIDPLSRPQSVGIMDPLSRPQSVGIMDPLSRPQSVGIMDSLSRPQSMVITDPLSRPWSFDIPSPLSTPQTAGIIDMGFISQSAGSTDPPSRTQSIDMRKKLVDSSSKPQSVRMTESLSRPWSVGTTPSLSRPQLVGFTGPLSRPQSGGIIDPLSRPQSVGIAEKVTYPLYRPQSVGIAEKVTYPLYRPQSVRIADPLSIPPLIVISDPHSRPQSVGMTDSLSKPPLIGISDPHCRPQSVGMIDPLSRSQFVRIADPLSIPPLIGISDQHSRPQSVGMTESLSRQPLIGNSDPHPRPQSVGMTNPLSRPGISDPHTRPQSSRMPDPFSRPPLIGISDPYSRPQSVEMTNPLSRPPLIGFSDPNTKPQSMRMTDPFSRPPLSGILDPHSRPQSVGLPDHAREPQTVDMMNPLSKQQPPQMAESKHHKNTSGLGNFMHGTSINMPTSNFPNSSVASHPVNPFDFSNVLPWANHPLNDQPGGANVAQSNHHIAALSNIIGTVGTSESNIATQMSRGQSQDSLQMDCHQTFKSSAINSKKSLSQIAGKKCNSAFESSGLSTSCQKSAKTDSEVTIPNKDIDAVTLQRTECMEARRHLNVNMELLSAAAGSLVVESSGKSRKSIAACKYQQQNQSLFELSDIMPQPCPQLNTNCNKSTAKLSLRSEYPDNTIQIVSSNNSAGNDNNTAKVFDEFKKPALKQEAKETSCCSFKNTDISWNYGQNYGLWYPEIASFQDMNSQQYLHHKKIKKEQVPGKNWPQKHSLKDIVTPDNQPPSARSAEDTKQIGEKSQKSDSLSNLINTMMQPDVLESQRSRSSIASVGSQSVDSIQSDRGDWQNQAVAGSQMHQSEVSYFESPLHLLSEAVSIRSKMMEKEAQDSVYPRPDSACDKTKFQSPTLFDQSVSVSRPNSVFEVSVNYDQGNIYPQRPRSVSEHNKSYQLPQTVLTRDNQQPYSQDIERHNKVLSLPTNDQHSKMYCPNSNQSGSLYPSTNPKAAYKNIKNEQIEHKLSIGQDVYDIYNNMPVEKEPSPFDVHCEMEYNETAFADQNMGGVAIALCHGAVLFEVAKRELHATTGLKNPNRYAPTRISLVFYQHKSLNHANHGWYVYERKLELLRQKKLETMQAITNGEVEPEVIKPANKKKKKKKVDSEEKPNIMQSSAAKYKYMWDAPNRRGETRTTDTIVTRWIDPQPVLTGPYQRWV